MSRGWTEEFWRFVALLLAALLLSTLFGSSPLWYIAAILIYLSWHLRNLKRLARWLNRRLNGEPPESRGIWEDIFLELHRVRLRNKKRHQRLVSRLSRFQEAAQALPDAIMVMDFEGVIEWCNKSSTRMLGIHTTHDLGQRVLNLVRSPSLVSYMHKREFDQPLILLSPVDEFCTLSIRIVPYGDDQQLLIARDITHLQRLEQMRRDFVANVSHEMRTPLTVISGYLEMFADDGDRNTDEFDDVVHRMNEQASRLQNIIGDLLLLSRLESDSQKSVLDKVNAAKIIDIITDEARSLSSFHNHDIVTEIDQTIWLQGNEMELRSAFSNLAFNAVRYTPDHGKIVIRWYKDEQGAHFAVEDSGIGIAPQYIPRLTERFYRVDVGRSRHTGGTGLGLAIVKHVLQRHDAQLKVTSKLGKGSTFRCDFPLSRIVTAEAKIS
jgi:two-component system phosphate regulon sensor histidine kinase PhoR